jgi:hypothetical protein
MLGDDPVAMRRAFCDALNLDEDFERLAWDMQRGKLTWDDANQQWLWERDDYDELLS